MGRSRVHRAVAWRDGLGHWVYREVRMMTKETVERSSADSANPIAWEFELANYRREDGTYTGWCPRLDWHKPNVPEASIRNLRPLYANEPQTLPDRGRIARAICCPSGCQLLGDSEDGEKCYCDTSDFNGSGIEKKTDAVLAACSVTRPNQGGSV